MSHYPINEETIPLSNVLTRPSMLTHYKNNGGMALPFYQQDRVKSRELVAGVHIRSMWGEKVMMALIDIQAGAEVPLHSHPHEQAGRVLSGAFYLSIGGDTKLLQEGDHYVIPGGVEHSARGTDSPSLALDIFSPPREEYKF